MLVDREFLHRGHVECVASSFALVDGKALVSRKAYVTEMYKPRVPDSHLELASMTEISVSSTGSSVFVLVVVSTPLVSVQMALNTAEIKHLADVHIKCPL